MQLLGHGNDIRMDRHLSAGTCCMMCGCGWVRVAFCWEISAWAIHTYTTERHTDRQTRQCEWPASSGTATGTTTIVRAGGCITAEVSESSLRLHHPDPRVTQEQPQPQPRPQGSRGRKHHRYLPASWRSPPPCRPGRSAGRSGYSAGHG